MRSTLFTLLFYFIFLLSFTAQENQISQKEFIKKVEGYILDKKLDSASIFLRQLENNDYTSILTRIKNREELSYSEYDRFLKSVSRRKPLNYFSIHSFINEFIKEPNNYKNINSDYVYIKWSQISNLRDEVTLEAANVEQEKLEAYVNKFDDADDQVLALKTQITSHPIIMYNIKQDLKGKELCLKSIEAARKLKDIKLEIIFLYYLTDFLVQEDKLQEYIDVSEQSLELEKKLPEQTAFHHAILEHLVDAYIYKGGNHLRIRDLLDEIYDNENSRANSYEFYVKFIAKLDENSTEKRAILNKFEVKNVFELTEKFTELGKDLNQHEFTKLIAASADALVAHGFYEESIRYKKHEIFLIKNIYSKELSETLSNYKTEAAVKEKEVEIESEKERTKIFIVIAALIGVFLLISLFTIRKIRKQSKELSEKNKLINKSLKEKELLVKEVHHRVKNNFQIVSSLLELQSKGIEDEKALELANEGKNRVKSMALIHQKLYQNESGLVDFDEYIQLLVKELSSLFKSDNKIDTSITSKDMSFDIDTAIPLGLIINEIITNSYKYAFKQGKENTLSISINKEIDNNFKLIIEDNGPGLYSNFDVKKAKSLGLRLVNRLVKQLHGTLSLTNEKGARFEIIFKDLHARQLVD
ncbi:Two-component sensor histidine kinase, contains HisKA and HATPase domains [Polaribacter sp. KT25b]|uniref:sensor histidine kinase n=1 Tax=Polaribacter sp. KT25b TaxID=1855336 RepID=UPI00087A21DE|nr:sensor histidine kinase [Polaribacter sp. KT25b]SDS44814.1 Two-component sensor histidine kinase, contains HisKA and HATPase domains [Polaribacter sp. KT25b]